MWFYIGFLGGFYIFVYDKFILVLGCLSNWGILIGRER